MLIDQLINNLGICVCSIYLPTYLTSTYILTFVNQNFKKSRTMGGLSVVPQE